MRSRKKIRLSGYDYSQDGIYFITICARDRENIFARIDVGAGLASARQTNNPQFSDNNRKTQIDLTDIGHIIEKQWNEIPNRFIGVSLDEFIIMPNHVHGILIVKQRADARPAPTIGDVICAFKSECAMEYLKHIKTNNLNSCGKIWQRSFYDHIIRNDESLKKIRDYIRNNPLNWEEDKNNLQRQGSVLEQSHSTGM